MSQIQADSIVPFANSSLDLNGIDSDHILNSFRGEIKGELIFNSISNPPKISAGTYEANGKVWFFNADYTTSLAANSFAQSLQTLTPNAWYLMTINASTGVPMIVLATGTVIAGATGNINSITNPTGNTKRLIIDTGSLTYPVAVGMVIKREGTVANDGVDIITGTDGSTYVEWLSNDTVTGGLVGTYTVYSRITTGHFYGSPTVINTDSDILKYTPNTVYNPSTLSYNVGTNGINTVSATDYRIVGIFGTDNSGNISNVIYSYKSRNNRNDNQIRVEAQFWYIDSGFYGINPSVVAMVHGNDYEFFSDGTNYMQLILNRNLKTHLIANFLQSAALSAATNDSLIYLNNNPVQRGVQGAYPQSTIAYSLSYDQKLFTNDILTMKLNNIVLYNNPEFFNVVMEIR